ncbi:phosphate starvation protein PhoH [Planctomycetales bacterium]|nr:phosphate starvation protein PhoH [Planctomycetales bacterium]GHT46170.1 phosphate starvation protein PhoH [Planctomycetales bacterium]
MYEATVAVIDSKALLKVFGPSDENLRKIREALDVKVTLDSGKVILRGTPTAVQRASHLLEKLQRFAMKSDHIPNEDIQRAISEVVHGKEVSDAKPLEVFGGKQIRSKTSGQAQYLELLRKKAIVFCVGPAGTGKTYLAVAKAVEALKTDVVRKIVLVRPAVEAGESLGFLPGDLNAKINPYLRPLFDALGDMIERDMLKRYMDEDRIEVIPLAYMRGRTLNNAAIILDEAQNTTIAQMKMFLTRMGEASTITVCGDMTQIDLPDHKLSGLIDAKKRLQNIEAIGMIQLTRSDIVRHPLVQEIVNAYESEN